MNSNNFYNSRERVSKALSHEEADMIPIDFGGVHTSINFYGVDKLYKTLGIKKKKIDILDYFQYIIKPDNFLLERFQSDIRGVKPNSGFNYKFKIMPDNTWEDEWGTKYIKPESGFFYDICKFIMADFDIDDLEKFVYPDPYDVNRIKNLREEITVIRNQFKKAVIIFTTMGGFFDCLYRFRGYEKAYIDLGCNLKFVTKFIEKMSWWMTSFWDNILSEVGDIVDVVQIGDDIGGQEGPLFNPKIYKNNFKPALKELISFIKSKTKAKIYFHACGSVYDFIQDFIDCGVDILNPVQVSAKKMDSKVLKKEFGKDIIFWGGGCDSQKILPYCTPKEIEEEVKGRINDLAPGGGFIFAPIHNIQYNVPTQNVLALFDSVIKYRKY